MGTVATAVGALLVIGILTISLVQLAQRDGPPTDAAPSPTSARAAPTGSEIMMRDLKYAPASLAVAVGATVTWRNADIVAHTVTPVDAAAWGTEGSGNDPSDWIQQGGSWSFTFSLPGTYVYYCIPHASVTDAVPRGMFGTIVVGGEAPPVAPFVMPSVSAIASPIAPARMLPDADGLVRLSLTTQEVAAKLADGTAYEYWTFDGTVPGPMLRVRQGDIVELTLRNAAESSQPHSIDLHAVTGPGGGAVLTQTTPNGSNTFTFKALNAGVYVYHCATPHIPSHVANGMYGLIVVEPPEGLPAVDREFYVVQGELYTDKALGATGLHGFSLGNLLDERPTYFTFNGAPAALVGDRALRAEVGETVRIYFGVGGFVPSSFHVIGEIFDRVYPEGGFPAVNDVQTTLVPAGGATMVEFTLDAPGTYLLVDHTLTRAIDRGAVAQLIVTGADAPDVIRGTPTSGSGH